MKCTECQKKVIEHGEGTLLVEAGPGSGKTFVIVERIKYLIKTKMEKGEEINPESFLVITFTKKAAENLKFKLRKELPNDIVSKMQISTIHSFCLEYLTKICKNKDEYSSLTLIDDEASEKKTLFIKSIIEELGFTGYSTVLDNQISSVVNKFGEYSSFMDIENHEEVCKELYENISNSREISQDYIDFVNDMPYFHKKLIDDYDKDYKRIRGNLKSKIKRAQDKIVEFQEELLTNTSEEKIKKLNEKIEIKQKTIEESEKEIIDLDKKIFSNSWYNARFLKIIEAYPKYLDFLKNNGYVDYDTLQRKTLMELRKDPENPYKIIFVDEFQDTDPLQFMIFQILKEHSDYFTAVGDVDQHIYAFRSSFNNFFDELIKEENPDSIALNTNFRSTKSIVELTEAFIKPQRDKLTKTGKNMESNKKSYDNHNFLIKNSSNDEEADKIFEIINYLKEKNLIKDYSDVAVLYRKHNNDTITNLIEKFNKNGIDFCVKGRKDLSKQDEVQSIITLMWYVTRKTYLGRIPSKDELDKINLKALCGEYFEKPFFSLADSTKEYLCNLQDSYYINITNKAYELTEGDLVEDKAKWERRYRNKHGEDPEENGYLIYYASVVKDRQTQDTLIDIFKDFQMPTIDIDKISDPTDKKFFKQLENIRTEIKQKDSQTSQNDVCVEEDSAVLNGEIEEKNKPLTILKLFYKLMALSNLYEYEFDKEIGNLAILTQIISNYEFFISETDYAGAFYFLKNAVEKYDSYQEEGTGVQLMTIHSAKGLEFPVTIISSLQKDDFPMENKDPNREKDYIFPNDTFYTPNEFLKYKRVLEKDENGDLYYKVLSIEDENELNDEEEERVLYVGMTRAKDVLILSIVGDAPYIFLNDKECPDQIERIPKNLIKELENIEELNKIEIGTDEELLGPVDEEPAEEEDGIVICGERKEKLEDELEGLEEPIVLNYSRYTKYLSCPFKYNLEYNLGFKRFDSAKAANRGSVFHKIMEKVNLRIIEGNPVSHEELESIILDVYNSMFNIEELLSSPEEVLSEKEQQSIKDFKEFKKNVEDYYYEYSLKRDVLEAEYDFELFIDNYILNGSIDLIYKDSDGEYVILDYKYAECKEDHIDGYKKQSHIYALALSQVPQYGKLVKKAIIHFVLGDGDKGDPYEYVEKIDESVVSQELVGMSEVSEKIKKGIFEKEPKEDCAKCAYRYFCKPKDFAKELYKELYEKV